MELLSNSYVIFFLIVAVALVWWCVLVAVRRRRVCDLAASLGAHYVSDGAMRVGHVEGRWEGRDYAMATNGALTSVFMRCENKGIPLCVSDDFYRDYPNWDGVFAIGNRRERVLIKEVTRKRVVVPLPEELHQQIDRVFTEFQDAPRWDGRGRKDGMLWVLHRQLEYRCAGVLSDTRRARHVLAYMNGVAVRLKFMPVA